MDEHGNIFNYEKHPDPESFIAERKLVNIPDDELTEVVNLSTQDRIAWYHKNKVQQVA